MLKSCNSDNKLYIRLTNQNIQSYIDSIPTNVEEITIWDYKMCLHPSAIICKESITVPSLKHFQKLRSFRCYGERLTGYPEMPSSIEQTLYVSCYINNEWVNSCVRHPKSYSPPPFQHTSKKHITPFFINSIPVDKSNEDWANMDDIVVDVPMAPSQPKTRGESPSLIWQCVFNMFSFNIFQGRFPGRSPKIRDSECELTALVIPDRVVTYDSIKRFKKTYDLVVNEGLIYVEYL